MALVLSMLQLLEQEANLLLLFSLYTLSSI